MNVPELLVGSVGLVGTVISLLTVRTFHLRQWKEAMYYFIAALFVLTAYQFVAGFELTSSPMVRGTVETGFVAIIAIGIYKMRETAKAIGA